MRIVLIILLILVLLIAVVCLSDIVVAVRLWDGEFTWSVRYFGIRILPLKLQKTAGDAKPEKASRRNNKKPAAEKPPEAPSGTQEAQTEPAAGTQGAAAETPPAPPEKTQEEKPKRKDFMMDKLWKGLQWVAEKADLAGSAVLALPGPFRRMLRSITLADIETDIVIGGEDAAKSARLYGTVHALLEPLLGRASHTIHVKRRRIAVRCDFTEDTSRWNFGFRVRVRIGTVLGAGIWLGWRFLTDHLKARKLAKGNL